MSATFSARLFLLAIASLASAEYNDTIVFNTTTTTTSTTSTTTPPHVCDVGNPCNPAASECVAGGTFDEYTCRCIRPYHGPESTTGDDCAKMSISTQGGVTGSDGSLYVQVAMGGDLVVKEAAGGRNASVFALEDQLIMARVALEQSIEEFRADYEIYKERLSNSLDDAERRTQLDNADQEKRLAAGIAVNRQAVAVNKLATESSKKEGTKQAQAIAKLQHTLQSYTTREVTSKLIDAQWRKTESSIAAQAALTKKAIEDGAKACPNGYAFNGILKTCEATLAVSQTRGVFGDKRPGGCWEDVATHDIKAGKVGTSSMLKVTYQAQVGIHQSGSSTTGCKFRLMVDGKSDKEVWSHSTRSKSWRINPTSYEWYVDASSFKQVGTGTEIYIKLQSCRQGGSTSCLFGWPSGSENSLRVEETSPGLSVTRKAMKDVRYASSNWKKIQDRSTKYEVKGDNSKLVVTYADVMGQYQTRAAPGCQWRVTINNQPVGKDFRWHANQANGWYIEPKIIAAVVEKELLQKGKAYTIDVWFRKQSGVSTCLSGWSNGAVHNSLTVVEIPAETKASMVHLSPANLFKDFQQTAANRWNNVNQRSLKFTKQSSGSSLSVAIMDTWGYNQNNRASRSCEWRVLFNGKSYGARSMHSHSGSETGWRIQANRLVWRTRDNMPVGSYSLQLQVYRWTGATSCRNGGPWADGTGHIEVTETI